MKPRTVIIKKYGNRRLYDTSASRYINLDEIAGMVRNGTEVKVVDADSGEDLTQAVLTQVIMEHAKDQPASLPLELLRQLIVASDHVGREFIMWYMKSAFDAYHKVESAMRSGISEVQTAAASPLDMLKTLLPKGLSAPQTKVSEVDELKNRVADLEKRLQSTAKKTPAKTASRKRVTATAKKSPKSRKAR